MAEQKKSAAEVENRKKALDLALSQIEKQFGRFNTFIKLNQTIITAKKKENYGGTDFNTSDFTLPTSQNLDYRFPLIMDAGLSFNFGKINKK